jgi:hypothetical protein
MPEGGRVRFGDCRSIQVARQTFVFPTGVKVMGATFTGLGITMKQILLGTTD